MGIGIKDSRQSPQQAPEPGQHETVAQNETPSLKVVTSLANLLVGFLRLARYAYFLRVPILIGAILFIFPVAALLPGSPVRLLFQNLFLMGPWPTFWSTTAALVLAWSVLLSGRIVLLNCADRFNVPARMTIANLSGRAVFGILVLALPAVVGQSTQQGDFGRVH